MYEFYLSVKTQYAANYIQASAAQFYGADENDPPKITWADGTVNTASFTPQPQGCGSNNGYLVATGLNAGALSVIGTAPDGTPLYELPTTSPLFQKLYSVDYSGGTYTDKPSLENLTADQLQAGHAIFVYKDGLGDLVVYLNNSIFMEGGCAKPVIYLYPTHVERVNVQVAADIKQSSPLYGADGWQDVLAQPSGQLTYQGNSYGSLYWEGTGDGTYPVLGSGIVVPSTYAVATIQRQLAEQGFKPNEIKDFLAYWQPRLPKTPYTRLTWLTTSQMNNLAPLTISPKPQTLIRTFLDFAGLNASETLTPQRFTTPKRSGFTVVEWGGLDHGVGLN